MAKWKEERENLQRLVDDGISRKEIAEMYGTTASNLKKVFKRLSIVSNKVCGTSVGESKESRLERQEMPSMAICLNCGKTMAKYPQSFGKFCSNSCQAKYQERQYIERWRKGEESGSINHGYSVSKHIRNYLMEKYDNACQRCGWREINPYTSKVPLQIHHVDGDSSNCKEENLMLLCPNCHSLTENFGSRNKNATRGRTEYFKKK